MRDAPVAAIAAAIQSGGLAQVEGAAHQGDAAAIWAERGSFDLDFLKTVPLDEARAWLAALPGVGPEDGGLRAAVRLRAPAMPVDTHVHRVSRRLGLVPDRASAEQAHELLEAMVPPDWYYAFHLNVIKHGREVCKAPPPALRDLRAHPLV